MKTWTTHLTLALCALSTLVPVTANGAAPAPAARPASQDLRDPGSVTFRSTGTFKAFMVNVKRDRSTTLTPVLRNGKLAAVKATIVDHHEKGKIIRGVMNLGPDGRVTAEDPEIVNSCNLLTVTPAVMAALKGGTQPVVTVGATEVRGAVLETRNEHTMIGAPAANGVIQVKSVTHSLDGTINLETVTQIAPDGLPIESNTHGTIKKGMFTLKAQMKTVRVRTQAAQDIAE